VIGSASRLSVSRREWVAMSICASTALWQGVYTHPIGPEPEVAVPLAAQIADTTEVRHVHVEIESNA